MNKDNLFKIFIGAKALYGTIEIFLGSFLLFFNHESLYIAISFFTKAEFAEDPNDYFMNYIINILDNLTLSGQKIIAIYFIIYGIIKLILIYEILKDSIRVYPYMLGIFSLAFIYEIYKLSISFTWTLFIIALFEMMTIYLTYMHYKKLKIK